MNNLRPLHSRCIWDQCESFFPWGCNMCLSFWVVDQKRCKSLSKIYFRKIARPFFISILYDLLIDSHWTCLRSCAKLDGSISLLAHPIILFFYLLLDVGKGWPRMMLCKMFVRPLQKKRDFMFAKTNPCPLTPYPRIFVLSSWDCAISWWCSHIGRCCHCRPHSNWFGVTSCFFSWGCDNNHGLDKRWFLSRSILTKHVSPFSYGHFWMSTPTGRQISSHGVGNKGH